MRIDAIWLVLCVSCAGSAPPPLPAPSSLSVDADREIVEIPPGVCPGFDGWLAMSENAARQLVIQDRQRETEHQLQLVGCAGARKMAEAQRDENAKALERASWWYRWGPIIAVTAGGVGMAAGLAFGVVAGRASR